MANLPLANCPLADRPLIVFDVNETLLDLQTMEPFFSASLATSRPCACGSPISSCIPRPSPWPAATFRSPISARP